MCVQDGGEIIVRYKKLANTILFFAKKDTFRAKLKTKTKSDKIVLNFFIKYFA